jgi:hypothetical protein
MHNAHCTAQELHEMKTIEANSVFVALLTIFYDSSQTAGVDAMKVHIFWWHVSPVRLYLLLLGYQILNSVIAYSPRMKVGSFSNSHRTSTLKALSAISKKAETYIKVKRLKQMISDGKGYQGYVDEMKKYEKPTAEDAKFDNPEIGNTVTTAESENPTSTTLNPVDVKKKLTAIGLGKSDPVEVMKKVLKYQQDKIDAQKLGDKSSLTEATNAENIEEIRKESSQGLRQSEMQTSYQISKTNVDLTYRIAFLPDTGVDEERRNFYASLSSLFDKAPNDSDLDVAAAQSVSLPAEKMIYFDEGDASICKNYCSLSFLPMPDVYMSNTKRHEQLWMKYIRTLDLPRFDVILAHGSSSEALLRYMESEPLRRVILIDASDIYTAGERHGRAFRYSLIAGNCQSISLLCTTQRYSTEAATVCEALRPYCSDQSTSLSNVSSSAISNDPPSALSAISRAIAEIVRNAVPDLQNKILDV